MLLNVQRLFSVQQNILSTDLSSYHPHSYTVNNNLVHQPVLVNEVGSFPRHPSQSQSDSFESQVNNNTVAPSFNCNTNSSHFLVRPTLLPYLNLWKHWTNHFSHFTFCAKFNLIIWISWRSNLNRTYLLQLVFTCFKSEKYIKHEYFVHFTYKLWDQLEYWNFLFLTTCHAFWVLPSVFSSLSLSGVDCENPHGFRRWHPKRNRETLIKTARNRPVWRNRANNFAQYLAV